MKTSERCQWWRHCAHAQNVQKFFYPEHDLSFVVILINNKLCLVVVVVVVFVMVVGKVGVVYW
jgi:hypothetical protein